MAGFRYTLVALMASLVSSLVLGQNLVTNSDFDADVTGWTTGSTATIVWHPLDADGNPLSGSAVVTNLSTTPGDSSGARQCIEGIVGGEFYRAGAEILVPSGQSETGRANVLIQWYVVPGCSSQLGSSSTPWIDDLTPDVWLNTANTFAAPPGVQAARLRLSVEKDQDSGILDAHFDGVEFAKEQLFSDGFESSDTSAWSSDVGGI